MYTEDYVKQFGHTTEIQEGIFVASQTASKYSDCRQPQYFKIMNF